MINKYFGAAYVLDNLAKPGSNVPVGLRQNVTQSAGFFGAVHEIVRLRFDVLRQEAFNANRGIKTMYGIETSKAGWTVIRVGYSRDERLDQKFATLGIGFSGPKLRVDYSLEKNLERTTGALHSVDLRLVF